MRFLSSTHRSAALRIFLPLTAGLLLAACGRSAGPDALEPSESVVERYPDSTRKVVEVRAGADSVVERRFYRPTGALRRVERGDSVAGYMDLHDLDSARVLRDYLQGRWRNTSASLSDPEANAYYVFDGQSLTFRTPSGESLETIGVDYGSNRVLHTEDGMPVTANIAGFDTVTVTGYTLVRQDTSAGIPEENRP
jgi:hypothetical protein